MKEDTFLTIEASSEGLYKDKGSKFIAFAWPVENEEQINEILSTVKKEYHDARHHCYAWILGYTGSNYRINDDGEPSGTAGKPIHGQLLSANLTNILIVVVRYFGGTKLGVRGLINAYKGAALDAIQNAKIVSQIRYDHFQINFDYPTMNDVMKIVKEYDLDSYDHDFQLKCKLKLKVRKSLTTQIIKAFENLRNVVIARL